MCRRKLTFGLCIVALGCGLLLGQMLRSAVVITVAAFLLIVLGLWITRG